jgi:hypothetical protein
MSEMTISGNTLTKRWGEYLTRIGERYIKKGRKYVKLGSDINITNPTSRLLTPYILVVNFTVNFTEKYTITTQFDYKELYKIKGSEDNPITMDEMFKVITHRRDKWFLKV